MYQVCHLRMHRNFGVHIKIRGVFAMFPFRATVPLPLPLSRSVCLPFCHSAVDTLCNPRCAGPCRLLGRRTGDQEDKTQPEGEPVSHAFTPLVWVARGLLLRIEGGLLLCDPTRDKQLLSATTGVTVTLFNLTQHIVCRILSPSWGAIAGQIAFDSDHGGYDMPRRLLRACSQYQRRCVVARCNENIYQVPFTILLYPHIHISRRFPCCTEKRPALRNTRSTCFRAPSLP